MKIEKISVENSVFQELLAYKNNRNKRISNKKFFVEGVQNIKEALNNNWKIYSFVFKKYEMLSDWAKNLINSTGAKLYQISDALMDKLSDKDDSSEIVAVVEMKEQVFPKLSKNPIILLLDRPSKKGNFGTILRSADAFGVDLVLYLGHGVDIYDSTVISASMGSFFKVPFKFLESNDHFIKYVEKIKKQYSDLQIVATSLQTNNNIYNLDFKKPTILLIGNEAKGLSKFLNDSATNFAKIDMANNVNSLNISCATTVFLYEIMKQRSFKG